MILWIWRCFAWNAGWKQQKWRTWRRLKMVTEEIGIWIDKSFYWEEPLEPFYSYHVFGFSISNFLFIEVTTFIHATPSSCGFSYPVDKFLNSWQILPGNEQWNIITMQCPSKFSKVKKETPGNRLSTSGYITCNGTDLGSIPGWWKLFSWTSCIGVMPSNSIPKWIILFCWIEFNWP